MKPAIEYRGMAMCSSHVEECECDACIAAYDAENDEREEEQD